MRPTENLVTVPHQQRGNRDVLQHKRAQTTQNPGALLIKLLEDAIPTNKETKLKPGEWRIFGQTMGDEPRIH